MSAEYITRDGDMVDWICWGHYGEQSGAVERVYEANQWLSDFGPQLPAGMTIVLPDIPRPADTIKVVRLWD